MRVYERERERKKVDTGVEIKKRHQGVNFLLKIYYMFKKYCRYSRLIAITDDLPLPLKAIIILNTFKVHCNSACIWTCGMNLH